MNAHTFAWNVTYLIALLNAEHVGLVTSLSYRSSKQLEAESLRKEGWGRKQLLVYHSTNQSKKIFWVVWGMNLNYRSLAIVNIKFMKIQCIISVSLSFSSQCPMPHEKLSFSTVGSSVPWYEEKRVRDPHVTALKMSCDPTWACNLDAHTLIVFPLCYLTIIDHFRLIISPLWNLSKIWYSSVST